MNYLSHEQSELLSLAQDKQGEYKSSAPFPNIYLDQLFNDQILDKILQEFPDMDRKKDLSFQDKNQIKLASKGEARFGDETRRFIHFLNSEPFLNFLSALTGIKHLMPDPYLMGGGLHQIKAGGLLKVHADFNTHPLYKLDRRINLLIYLNKDWSEDYGGHLELWDQSMTKPVKRILPVFNRTAVFSTTSTSYHGHPDPLTCPPDRSRKSIALYYYTNGRPKSEQAVGHSTLFQYRPGSDDQRFDLSLVGLAKEFCPPILLRGIKRLRLNS